MVYAGPSRGCQRCRQRKKKCDGRLPRCTRCENANVPCQLRSEGDRIFRDDTEKAKQRALRAQDRWHALSTLPPGAAESALAVAKPSSLATIPAAMGLCGSETGKHLISFFCAQFVIPATLNAWPGWLRMFPQKYASAPDSACAKAAAHAASYAIMANKFGNPQYMIHAQHSYDEALSTVRASLERHVCDDGTMMAVALLDTFDTIVDANSGVLGPHMQGLKALLEQRVRAEGKKSPEFLMFPQCHTLLYELKARIQPSRSTSQWVSHMDLSLPRNRVIMTYFQIARVCAPAAETCRAVHRQQDHSTATRSPELDAELFRLIVEMDTVDRVTATWWHGAGPDWEPTRRYATPEQRARGALPVYFDTYKDLWMATVWNTIGAARLVLLETLLECVLLVPASSSVSSSSSEPSPRPLSSPSSSSTTTTATPTPPPLTSHPSSTPPISPSLFPHLHPPHLRSRINTTIAAFRASMPFVLGQVDAAGRVLGTEPSATALSGQALMWPLSVVVACHGAAAEHGEWARSLLRAMAGWTGIRRAWSLAAGDAGAVGETERG